MIDVVKGILNRIARGTVEESRRQIFEDKPPADQRRRREAMIAWVERIEQATRDEEE